MPPTQKENQPPANNAADKKDDNKRAAEKQLTPGAMKSQCVGYFNRVANGQAKRATAEEIAQAKEALQTMAGLPKCDQDSFAKCFFDNKRSKNFGFIKDYTEKVQAAKQVTQAINENYLTRIAVLIVKKTYEGFTRSLIPSPQPHLYYPSI